MPKLGQLSSVQQKELAFFTLIAMLFVFPIIHANIYFADDLSRVMSGAPYWEYLGRPLASVVLIILSTCSLNGLVDIAPLTQILSGFFLALSAFYVNEYLKRENGEGVFWAAALIIVNPFFLYNLSYRYDSFGMSLGILFATWSFCLSLDGIKAKLMSILLLIACLSLYQPNANFFIGLVAIEIVVLARHQNLKTIIHRMALRALQFMVAYGLYYLTIAQVFILGSAKGRSGIISLNSQGLSKLWGNLESFTSVAFSFLSPAITFYSVIFAVLFCASLVVLLKRSKNVAVLLLALPFALLVYYVSLFGPMVFLESALVSFRTIPSLYLVTVIFVLVASFVKPSFAKIAFIPLLVAISTSYQYGVAWKNQRDYEENLFTLIQYDLLNNQLDREPVYVLGSTKRASHAKKITENNPLISGSVHQASAWIASSLLEEKGVLNAQFFWAIDDEMKHAFYQDICVSSNTIYKETSLYSIITMPKKSYVLLSQNKTDYCSSL